MRTLATDLPGVLVIEPHVIGDARGFFLETYRRDRYESAGIDADFVQDNHSRSAKGVLRGLHFQHPNAQGKLVRVVRGAIFDVAVDIRRGSPHFGKWTGAELSGDNHRQMWIPPGFAHGFLSLADETDVLYKCSDIYAPQHEHCVLWNDAALGIAWPDLGLPPRVSAKDAAAPRLRDAAILPTFGAG
ncbi:MAG: dTDP-4-dehydrorhamnose 3,5-epimerase [Alphaproteobacteria bacterium]